MSPDTPLFLPPAFLPAAGEITLLSLICVVLIVDLFVDDRRRWVTYLATLATLAITAGVVLAVAPDGPVYQAGTLSGNPVAMAAGTATLNTLLADQGAAYAELEKLSAQLEQGLRDVLLRLGVEWSVVRIGSILWLALQSGEPPQKFEEIRTESQ